MSEQSVDHLERAKSYIERGEDFYRKAASEIQAAMDADPQLSYSGVGDRLGRSKSWCQRLVTHFTSVADPEHPPFGGPDENEARYQRHDRRKVEQIAQERPEAVAEAIAKADPETQRKIADAIVTSPTVEPSLADAATPKVRQPRPMKSIGQTVEESTFGLWDASQRLMDEMPSDEEWVRIVASAEKAQRLAAGITMLRNGGQVDDAFRDLVAELEEA